MEKQSFWILFCFGALFVWGQVPDLKEDGEMEQIRERVNWFIEQRGLNQEIDPGKLRANAVEEMRVARYQREALQSNPWMEMGPSPMTMGSWQMGKVAGRVDAIEPVPGDSNTIYLGAAAGGVWKTTDGGVSWTSIFDDIGTLTIGSIYVESGHTDHVWVGTGEHMANCVSYFGLGLFKSEDGGQTFTAKNGSGGATLDLSYISGIAVHRTNPQIVMAGGNGYCSNGSMLTGGLFRSIDGGSTWTELMSHNITELVMHPTNDDIFYAAVAGSGSGDDGVWMTSNSGANWQKISSGLPSSFSRLRLVISLSQPSTLFALVYPSASGSALYRTVNSGTNWTLQNSNACEGQCSYNQCLAIHPTNPDRLIVGSVRFAETNNAGTSLTYLVSGWGSSQKVHQDTHVLEFDPDNGNRFWVGGDGGLWRTDDGGVNYANLNSDLNITQFYDIAVDPGDSQKVLGGAQDNSCSMTQGAKVWDLTVVSGDGFMNMIDPRTPQTVYQTSYPSQGPSIARSYNGGVGGWTWLNGTGLSSGDPWPWVTPMAISGNPDGTATHLFVGSNRIYRSDNDGNSWTAMAGSSILAGGYFRVVVTHIEKGKLEVYGGSSSGQIFKTDDALAGTVQWDNISSNYAASNVTDIAVTPGDHKWLFATSGHFGVNNQLYRSGDQGQSWQPVGDGIPNIPANTVAVDPLDSLRVFVGTDIGVYVSTDRGDTFVPMMNGMPLGNVISDLEIDDSPYTLTAGTYGRGAWQADISLAILAVEAGMDQSTCIAEPVALSAAGSNAVGTVAWSWTILSGPDSSLSQLSAPDQQATQFTPSVAGQYTLQVELTDSRPDPATDTLSVTVGDYDAFSLEMRELWATHVTTNHDRNGNDVVDIIDILIQTVTPICL